MAGLICLSRPRTSSAPAFSRVTAAVRSTKRTTLYTFVPMAAPVNHQAPHGTAAAAHHTPALAPALTASQRAPRYQRPNHYDAKCLEIVPAVPARPWVVGGPATAAPTSPVGYLDRAACLCGISKHRLQLAQQLLLLCFHRSTLLAQSARSLRGGHRRKRRRRCCSQERRLAKRNRRHHDRACSASLLRMTRVFTASTRTCRCKLRAGVVAVSAQRASQDGNSHC